MKYAFIFVFLMGCDWWNANYPSDNPIEEIAEQVIEQETGLELDLSPNSPEGGRKQRPTAELIK